ncbi:MAG: hypothetical protein OXR66_04550 [Candidatus Woesearchaeota archaeon]|nr:hypothetical protein [Candidatus Woesearchaeota archaeon]
MNEHFEHLESHEELGIEIARNAAFQDEPGNSLVYAGPKSPGFHVASIEKEVTKGHYHDVCVTYREVTGRYWTSPIKSDSLSIILGGVGVVANRFKKEQHVQVSSGDCIIRRPGSSLSQPSFQVGNLLEGKLGVVSLEFQVKNHFTNDRVKEAFSSEECRIIRGGSRQHHHVYDNGEQYTIRSPTMTFDNLAMIAGIPRDELRVGVNAVRITGDIPEGEELHYHHSSIYGVIADGVGDLIQPNGRTQAMRGDCVVVPRGQLHYFEAPSVGKTSNMIYAALEFGEKIDYQKHMHD